MYKIILIFLVYCVCFMRKVCKKNFKGFQTVIKTDHTCTQEITQCLKKCSNLQLNFDALIIQAETIL